MQFEAPIAPSIAVLPDDGKFVSAGVFAQKAKANDVGILAALELIIDDGTFELAGRRAFLAQLQEHLLSEWARSEKDADLADAIGGLSAARSLVDGADADSSIANDTGLRLRAVRPQVRGPDFPQSRLTPRRLRLMIRTARSG